MEALEIRLALATIPAPSGIVAWWPGDGTAADSAGTNNGILEGGATFAAGLIGQAFSLDGIDDRIRIPNHATLNPAAGFTIEAWVRPNKSDGARVIVSKWNDDTGDWSYIFKQHNPAAGKLRIELSKGGGNDLADLFGQVTIPQFEWTHVAVTFDTTTVRLYVNGELDGSHTVVPSQPVLASNADFLIGAVTTGGSVRENFGGLIDEVKLYDRGLTATEIRAAYEAVASAAVAGDDSYTVPNGNTFVSPNSVLDNDIGAVRAALVDPPQHGELTLNRDGTFTYTPDRNFFSNDSFTYRASELSTSIATVSIDVTRPIATVLPLGAVAWWKAEGNANDSVGTHHGSLQANAAFASGKVRQAFDFHGGQDAIGDYVEVPDSAAWPVGTNDFTINLWMNLRSFHQSGGGHLNPLVGQVELPGSLYNGQGNSWALFVEGFTDINDTIHGRLIFHFHGDGILGSGIRIDAGFSPNLRTWYNVALAKGGSTYTFYVNGSVVGTVDDPTMIRDVAAPLTIGSTIGGQFPDGLNGMIDELTFFNRALSSTEMLAIYNAASAGLVVYAEDGPQSIEDWAQELFPSVPPGGSPDLTFETTNDKPSLFSEQPVIDSTGTLTFTPAPNSSGITTVTVVLKTGGEGEDDGDGVDGGDTQTFTIEVVQQKPAQNDVDPNDVNNDGWMVPGDALDVINYLNGIGPGAVPPEGWVGPFYDVNGDNFIAAIDALTLIDLINASPDPVSGGGSGGGGVGDGEGESAGSETRAQLGVRSQRAGVTGQQADVWELLAMDVGLQPAKRRLA